jgi:hypothetical protein
MANILYSVFASNSVPSAFEQYFLTRMTDLGHTVTPIYSSSGTWNQSYAESFDMVVFSPQCGATAAVNWITYTKNLLALKSFRSKDLGMCSSGTIGSGEDSTTITDDTHPIATGFANGSVQLFTTSQNLQYLSGTLAGGLTTISTNGAGVGIGAIDPDGALTPSGTSAGRRVHFPSSDVASGVTPTADHGTLFDQAFNYALFGAVANQPGQFGNPGYLNVPASIPQGSGVLVFQPNLTQNPLPAGAYSITNGGEAGLSADANSGDLSVDSDTLATGVKSVEVTLTNSEGSTVTTVNFELVAAVVPAYDHENAMALLNFENAALLGNDVSGFGRHATSITDITQATVAGLDKMAVFNGSTSVINMSNLIASYATNTSHAKLIRVVPNSLTGAQVIYSVGNSGGASSVNNLTLWRNGSDLRFHVRVASEVIAATISGFFISTTDVHEVAFTTGPAGWGVWGYDGTTKSFEGGGGGGTTVGGDTSSLAAINSNAAIDYWTFGEWPFSALPFDGAIKDAYMVDGEINDKTFDMAAGLTLPGGERSLLNVLEFIWGQSNAEGNSLIDAGIDDIAIPKTYQFRNDTQVFDVAENPLASVTPIAGSMGKWKGLARGVIPKLPYGATFTVMNVANGNTDLDVDWEPVAGPDFANAVTRATSLTAEAGVFLQHVVTHAQIGENNADKGSSAANVTTWYQDVIDAFDTQISWFDKTAHPIVTTSIAGPADNTAARDVVNTGLSTWAANAANYYYNDCLPYAVLFDNYHLNSASQRRAGKEILDRMGVPFDLTVLLTTATGTKTGQYTVTASFAANIPTLTTGDVTCTNGTVSNVTGSGNVWTITIEPDSGSGNNTIDIASAAVVDEYNQDNTASNTLVVPYNVVAGPPAPPVGYAQIIMADDEANLPSNSVLKGATYLKAGDAVNYEQDIGAPNPQLLVLDTFGVPTDFISPGSYVSNFEAYDSANAWASYGADTMNINIGDNVPDAAAIADKTDQSPNTLVYSDVTFFAGMDAGVTVFEAYNLVNCTVEYSNDGTNWQTTDIIYTSGQTRFRFAVTSSATPLGTVNASATINSVGFTFNVVTEAAAAGTVTVTAIKQPSGALYPNQLFNVLVLNNADRSVLFDGTATTDAVTADLEVSDAAIGIGTDCMVIYWQGAPTYALVKPSVISV